MRNLKKYSSLFLMLILCQLALAHIKLPSIFGDGMVLQQQMEVSFWGTAEAGKNIKIWTSWNDKEYMTKSEVSSGKWQLKVHTPIAGGPFIIKISDGEVLELKDVLIGEVWVCSGQSNMEMTMRGFKNQPVLGANRAIATSDNSKIRLFNVQNNYSVTPIDTLQGSWKYCEPENVSEFSATAYFFGRLLQKSLDVPIGLINTSVGGSKIEAWIGKEQLKKYDWIKIPKSLEGLQQKRKHPTLLYNAMINPLIGYAFKGAIWYQGEANTSQYQYYQGLMEDLVSNWRKEWNVGDFPFYFVQLAPYARRGISTGFLREAQLKAAISIPNSGMASILDIGSATTIHPPRKREVGERLAFLALAKTYNKKGIAWSGPVLKDYSIEGSEIHLTFDNAPYGLTSYDRELSNFVIAGEDRVFYPAKAEITKNGIAVKSERVLNPVAVRYAFDSYVVGDLFNNEGLPAPSFRTDNWKFEKE